MTRAYRQGLSWGFAALGAVVVGAVLTLGGVASNHAVDVLALAAVLAIILGVRRYRPRPAAPWLLLAAAVAVPATADLLWSSTPALNAGRSSPVWWMVLVSLVRSMLLGVAVLLLIRRRPSSRDLGPLIDAAIVVVGLSLVAWVWLLAPMAQRGASSDLEQVAVSATPFFSLLVLLLALRFTLDAAERPVASWLLLAGLLWRVAGDLGSAAVTLAQAPIEGRAVEAAWVASWVLMGAAALHPTMRQLSSMAPSRGRRLNRCQLCLLSASCLLAPATLGLQALRGADLHLTAALVAWIVMIALVLARMAGLVHQLGAAVRHLERATSRERVLNRLGTALVAAQDRQSVYRAALTAARELLPGGPAPSLAIFARQDDGSFSVICSHGPSHLQKRLPELEGVLLATLRHGRYAVMTLRSRLAREETADDQRAVGEQMTLHPLRLSSDRQEVLAVVTAEAGTRDTTDGLAALTSSSALALERVSLSEEVHRRRSDERLSALVRNTTDLITVVCASGYLQFATESVKRAFGAIEEGRSHIAEFAHAQDREALRTYLDRLAAKEEVRPLEWRLRGPHGWRDYETVGANLLDDPNVAGIVLTSRDITERKALQQQLQRRAMFDQLTGLPNRVQFSEQVTAALEGPGTAAVLFIDLDDFKIVNDSMGHAMGDRVIAAAGARLARGLRSGDTAARLGGDEFGVLLPQVHDAAEAKAVAGRIVEAFRPPFVVEGRQFALRASVGVAIARKPSLSAGELLRNADLAMYRAKATGKGCAVCYEPEMHRGLVSRLDQQAQLAAALQQNQILPHYQPIMDLHTGTIAGVEVLARWQHPDHGLLRAAEFLGVAEQTGLIVPLGAQILRQASRQLAEWRQRPQTDGLFLSVNLCHRQLQAPELLGHVHSSLAKCSLPANALVLELPETCLLDDTLDTLERLGELRALGVQVAIAGFGTGSLSLSSLAGMTADLVKLDSVLLFPQTAEGEGALAAAVRELVRGLRLPVVAQGVETEPQRAALLALGCRYGQGKVFGEPAEARTIYRYLPGGHVVGL